MVNNPFKLGDIVEIAAYAPGVGPAMMVVDIDPPGTMTPYPSVVLSWRVGRRTYEGIMQAEFVRRVMA